MVEILWHRRETRRQTEKTNFDLTTGRTRSTLHPKATDPKARMKSLKLEEKIESVVVHYPELRVVILFGSAASDRLAPHSDIDIAVSSSHPLTLERMEQLHLDLARTLPREVDLIDLQRISGTLLKEILAHGIVIRSTSGTYARLVERMWYNQADMMPYVRRILEKHVQRFVHG